MKKVILSAICIASIGAASAQKINVDNAKKLSGKFDKIEEARSLIKTAMEDPSTAKDANTYYVAGKIEFDAFDKGLMQASIKPDDPSADPVVLAEELLNGYNYFLQALPYDSLPNEKGEIKPKVSKNIVNTIADHHTKFDEFGVQLYNAKKYYPEAYQSFIIFADMPDMQFLGSKAPKSVPSQRANAYFNAGICAYTGSDVANAAKAFRAARLMGSEEPKVYSYEIASWEYLSQNDSTLTEQAKAAILEAATAGYEKFGISDPTFIKTIINSYVLDEDYDGALRKIDSLIAENPNNPVLIGLKAFALDRKGDDEGAVNTYKEAIVLEDCDFDTLKRAAFKILLEGSQKLDALEPSDKTGKLAVKTGYFDVVNDICQRAKGLNPGDSGLQTIIDRVDYALTTYF